MAADVDGIGGQFVGGLWGHKPWQLQQPWLAIIAMKKIIFKLVYEPLTKYLFHLC